MNCADLCTALLATRQSQDAILTPEGAAIYAFFLQPRGLLLPIRPAMDGLLYVATAATGAAAREQFVQPSSASDLRRTLGAILRRHLGLFPGQYIPASESGPESFMFAYDGEIILSRWMRANLLASVVPAELPTLPQIEAALVADLQPPLNLTGWANPQRPLIEKFQADALCLAKGPSRAAA